MPDFRVSNFITRVFVEVNLSEKGVWSAYVMEQMCGSGSRWPTRNLFRKWKKYFTDLTNDTGTRSIVIKATKIFWSRRRLMWMDGASHLDSWLVHRKAIWQPQSILRFLLMQANSILLKCHYNHNYHQYNRPLIPLNQHTH